VDVKKMNNNEDIVGPESHIPTIPKKGMIEKIRRYILRMTGKPSLVRFIWERGILTVFSCVPTAAGSVIRGVIYKLLLGKLGKNGYIEKNVKFNIPKNIFIGDRIFIGESCYIDADTPKAKIEIGDDVYISRYCVIRGGKTGVKIGSNVNIGWYSMLYGYGGIEIGDNTLLANNVQIHSGNHVYKDPNKPIRLQGGEGKPVKIDEDVWLASYTIVLPGITIGKGSVIGAGSVVTKDIPPYSIAVGNPAKVIGKRGE
jgi:acetyltransferase-like isoleucine patch superfamily enzyme